MAERVGGSGRRPGRFLVVGAIVLIGWALVAYVAVPHLIRAAYEGNSAAFLNRIITGQETHPVERYLSVARLLAHIGTFFVSLPVLAGLVWVRWRGPLQRVWARSDQPKPAGPADLLATAACLGVAFGLFEAFGTYIRLQLPGAPTVFVNPDHLWMAPLAQAVLFTLLTLLFYPVLRISKRSLGYRAVVMCAVMVGLFAALRTLRVGLHPVALWILALGVGAQAARLLDLRPGVNRILRRAAIPALSALALVPIVVPEAVRFRVAPTDAPGSRTTGAGLAQTADGSPNILLLVLDTARGESMSLYGYGRETTPNLEELGARGVVFDRAFATGPWTLPTHASLFTGRYPYELGIAWDRPLDDRYPTLAGMLGRRGYARGGFVANRGFAGRVSGLARGFGHYVDYNRSLAEWVTSALTTRAVTYWVWKRIPSRSELVGRKYAPEVNAEFLSWLDRVDQAKPFFAFLNYFEAHAPYEHFTEFEMEFGADDRAPLFGVAGRTVEATDSLNALRDAYDSSIAYIDYHIGLLLRELDERGRLDNTVVIVTADHGEHLGSRQLMGHANSLYSQVLVVPLLINWPGRVPAGLRVESPVSLRAVPATVMDLVAAARHPFPGASLRRFWTSVAPSTPPVLSEVDETPHTGFPDGPASLGYMRLIADGGFHYILNGDGREELYDIASDPLERWNLAETSDGLRHAARMREILRTILAAERAARSASPTAPGDSAGGSGRSG